MYITPLTPTTAEVSTGSTLKLRAAARFKDNTIRDITNFAQWFSGDPEAATVSFGVFTPKKAGLTAILALDANGFAYDYKYVRVNKAVMTGLEVQPKSVGLQGRCDSAIHGRGYLRRW